MASCRIAGREVSGTVLDITRQGAFFCPDDAQPLTLTVDQIVIIEFESEPALAGIEMPCRVRWIGYSDRHGRHGVGLEFSGGQGQPGSA